METTLHTYDPRRYDFRGLIARFIGTNDLENLHANYAEAPSPDNSLYKNMEQSPIFHAMYAGLNSERGQAFYALYERFLHEVIRPQYDGPIYYQQKPSHRILFADVPGQSRFHRDADYGHDPREVNYWVPLTPAYATNTFWIESSEGRGDYQPVRADIGQYVCFRGSTLSHGARANDTGHSRVSFDFRVIAAADAPPRYRGADTGSGTATGNPVQDNALKFQYLG